MSEVAEKAAEATAEVVEESVDGVVEVMEVVRNNPVTLALVGVAGLGIGAVGGYFFAAWKLGKKFDAQMVEEIAQAREFYSGVYKTDEDGKSVTPQEVLASRHGEEAAQAVRKYQGRTEEEPENGFPAGEPHDDIVDEERIQRLEREVKERKTVTPDEEVTERTERNVFRDDTFDLEEEIKYRTEEKPYIITHDEYFAGERDYDTQSLTYYEVDDTLTDEHDKPMEQTDKLVGDDHLVRFGSGSKDPNIVYVRNDRLGMDYEIVRSRGSYLEEVLGMLPENENELKHSDQRDRRRALRRDDG